MTATTEQIFDPGNLLPAIPVTEKYQVRRPHSNKSISYYDICTGVMRDHGSYTQETACDVMDGLRKEELRSSGRRAVVKPCGVTTTTFTTVEDDKSQWRHKEGQSSTIVNLEEI